MEKTAVVDDPRLGSAWRLQRTEPYSAAFGVAWPEETLA
jgi:hypothetical protein